MAGPGDETAAGMAGRGRLRASHADREQVIDVLKAAFVQGRLAKDEFDTRIGEALAARTYAELAAVTSDIPAEPPAAQLSKPARARDPKPVLRPDAVIMAVSAVYAGLSAWVFVVPSHVHGGVLTLVWAMFTVFIVVRMIGLLASQHQERSPGQLPQRPAPGADGQSSGRLASADPMGQLPSIADSQQHIAEAVPSRLPRPQRSGSGSPRRWRPRGLLTTGEMTVVPRAWPAAR